MKHRHSGKYKSRTPRGSITYKHKPIHKHKRPEWKMYKEIVKQAKNKGYKVSDINRKNLTVDEVDIPESYLTDGLIIPDNEWGKGARKERRDLVYIDDDAVKENKKKAFAHELGHAILFATGHDDEESNSNDPKIERKADKIGADILGMTIKKFNSPDATFKDTVNRKHWFDNKDPIESIFTKERQYMFPRQPQSLFHAGDKSPSEIIEKGEPLFGFSNIDDAERWREKYGGELWQFQTDKYNLDPKTYSRGTRHSDDEFIAGNVIKEEKIGR